MTDDKVVRFWSQQDLEAEENVQGSLHALHTIEALIQNDEIHHVAIIGVGPRQSFTAYGVRGVNASLMLVGAMEQLKGELLADIARDEDIDPTG